MFCFNSNMEIKALRELEGNRTEVVCKNEMTPHRTLVRYFSVPTDKKDEFISEFEQKTKKDKQNVWIGFFGASLLGSVAGNFITKNIMWLKLLGTVLGTLAGGKAAMNLLGRNVNNSEKHLFDKFDVKEHTYLGKDGVPEVLDPNSRLLPDVVKP